MPDGDEVPKRHLGSIEAFATIQGEPMSRPVTEVFALAEARRSGAGTGRRANREEV
jgi:hypothetical protein